MEYKNNKGFSLIELMVGITILAIITIPLMNNFIVSLNTSNRAYEITQLSQTANNVIASIEANSLDEIIDKKIISIFPSKNLAVQFYTDATFQTPLTAVLKGNDSYYMVIRGVSFNDSHTPVDIQIIAEAQSDPVYTILNSKDVVLASNPDIIVKQASDDTNPDKAFIIELEKEWEAYLRPEPTTTPEVTPDPSATPEPSMTPEPTPTTSTTPVPGTENLIGASEELIAANPEIIRTITIDLVQNGLNVDMNITYKYNARTNLDGEERIFELDSPVATISQPMPAQGQLDIFFLYNAFLTNSTHNVVDVDNIIVNNNGINANLSLVKQNVAGSNAQYISGSLILNEKFSTHAINLYTNANEIMGDEIFERYTMTKIDHNSIISNLNSALSIVKKEDANVIYKTEIKIFEEDKSGSPTAFGEVLEDGITTSITR